MNTACVQREKSHCNSTADLVVSHWKSFLPLLEKRLLQTLCSCVEGGIGGWGVVCASLSLALSCGSECGNIFSRHKKTTIPPVFPPATPLLSGALSIVSDPNLHPREVKGNSVTVVIQNPVFLPPFLSSLPGAAAKKEEQKRWRSHRWRLDRDVSSSTVAFRSRWPLAPVSIQSICDVIDAGCDLNRSFFWEMCHLSDDWRSKIWDPSRGHPGDVSASDDRIYNAPLPLHVGRGG